jgi:hypothetical protein
LAPHQSPEGLLLVSTIRGVAAHRRVRREPDSASR